MGLTAINSIYQARFNRYLHNRGIKDTSQQHVWAFLGDGEMGEPESLGAIRHRRPRGARQPHLRHQLQPAAARRPGHAATARSSRSWRPTSAAPAGTSSRSSGAASGTTLLARDVDGVLVNQMNTTPDGQFQTYSVEDGAYIREHFFGGDPRLRKMVEHMTDDADREAAARRPRLPQGVRRVRRRHQARRPADGDPGPDHQGLDDRRPGGQERHPPDEEARPRPTSRSSATGSTCRSATATSTRPTSRPARRRSSTRARTPPRSSTCSSAARQLGGSLPSAGSIRATPLKLPGDEIYAELKQGSGKNRHRHHDGRRPAAQGLDEGPRDRPADRADRARRVPHVRHGLDVPDAPRSTTRGGQQYESVDRKLLLSYKESAQGQMLHEGISEAGAMASATAAGSAYSTHGEHDDPVLHLLLDVRLPAHRRLDLGDGRPARRAAS